MNKPKLTFRFHNPNQTDEGLIRVLLHVCIDANRNKVDDAIRASALQDEPSKKVSIDCNTIILDSQQVLPTAQTRDRAKKSVENNAVYNAIEV